MAERQLPSPEVLRQLLRYEPDTGKLFWRARGPEWFVGKPKQEQARWNNRFAGKEAITATNARGYRNGAVRALGLGNLTAHRAAWTLHYGRWPKKMLDHANGIKSDNRIVNLREVDEFGNAKNQQKHSRNTSGITGVHWCKGRSRWQATIFADGKTTYLGNFKSIEDAAAARKAAEERLGFHVNHGRNGDGENIRCTTSECDRHR